MSLRLLTILIAILSSCAAPRYSYYFDTSPPDFATLRTGRPLPKGEGGYRQDHSRRYDNAAPITPSEGYSASLSTTDVNPPAQIVTLPRVSRPREMSPRSVRSIPVSKDKALLKTQAEKSMHADLRRSIIFVLLGVGLLLAEGEVFVVIGTLSLLIGIIFGIKWLLRKAAG